MNIPNPRLCISLLHYGDLSTTMMCLQSLINTGISIPVYIINNTTHHEDEEKLSDFGKQHKYTIHVYTPTSNLGFAGGHNVAITHFDLLSYKKILFLNNDTLLSLEALTALCSSPEEWYGCTLVDQKGHRENIGITLYKSGYPSHRMYPSQALLGPCGACFVLSTNIIRKLLQVYGEVLDEDFFLYIEDTDLNARLTTLGYIPSMLPCHITHRGGAGSGGGYNDTIAYYGMRNCRYFRWKFYGEHRSLWFLLGDIAAWAAALLQGKLRIWVKAKQDAVPMKAIMLRKHAIIRPHLVQKLPIDNHFFVPGHLRTLLHRVFGSRA